MTEDNRVHIGTVTDGGGEEGDDIVTTRRLQPDLVTEEQTARVACAKAGNRCLVVSERPVGVRLGPPAGAAVVGEPGSPSRRAWSSQPPLWTWTGGRDPLRRRRAVCACSGSRCGPPALRRICRTRPTPACTRRT